MQPLLRTRFGNPILRQTAKRVPERLLKTAAFTQLVKDMFFTIKDIGVGLAAPQIGQSLQLAVINVQPLPHRPNVSSFRRILVNPEIIAASKDIQYSYEGCLSFDELRGEAVRAQWVEVRYHDEKGEEHVERAEGFLATVFQHEIDHLNGVLFIDHVVDTHTIVTTDEFNKRFGKR